MSDGLVVGRGARWALFALTLLAYASVLGGPFQFDDRGVIVREPAIQSLGAALASGGLRPLLKLSYAFSWLTGGGSPVAFNVFNHHVHLLCVELVMRLYSAGTDRALRFPFPVRASPGALLAGALFALHPLQTEAVTYISGRSSSLATAFSLLALLLYIEGTRSGRRSYWLGYAGLAFAAALGSKETSLTLPFGFLLWELAVERSPLGAALKRFGVWLGLGALASVALIMNERYFALLYDVLGQRSLLDSLRLQLHGVAYLAERFALLAPLCIDPGLFMADPSWTSAGVTAALLTLALALAAWLYRRGGSGLPLFGVAWLLLQVLVPFVLLPRVDVINERHAYPAGAGLFLGIAALGAARLRSARSTWAIAGVVGLGLATLTWQRNRDYQSEVRLWQATVRVAPDNPRAQNNLGVAYERAGRLPEARVAYARAVKLEPRYAAARENLLRASRPKAGAAPAPSAAPGPVRANPMPQE